MDVSFSDYSVVVIANGNVFSLDELIENALSKVGTFDTHCLVKSHAHSNVAKFNRNLADIELAHTNRKSGLWRFKQLHTGLDDILTNEQLRAPIENIYATEEVSNHITFKIEAHDSEKNGNGVMLDSDLSLSCEKDKVKGPISLADVKKALGNVIKFTK